MGFRCEENFLEGGTRTLGTWCSWSILPSGRGEEEQTLRFQGTGQCQGVGTGMTPLLTEAISQSARCGPMQWGWGSQEWFPHYLAELEFENSPSPPPLLDDILQGINSPGDQLALNLGNPDL